MIKYLFQVHCLIQLILLSKGTLVRTNVFLDLRFSFNVNIRLTGRGTYLLQLGLNFVFLE